MKRFFILASAMFFESAIFARSTITEEAVEPLMVSGIIYAMSHGDDYHADLKRLASRHVDDKKHLRPLTLEMLGSYFVELAEIEPNSRQKMIMPLLQEVKKQAPVLISRIKIIEQSIEEEKAEKNVSLEELLRTHDVVDADSVSEFHAEDPVKTALMKAKQITIPDIFNGADYKQSFSDEACVFLSALAGIMYTDQGRKRIQQLLVGQDSGHVYFKFYAPLINFEDYNGKIDAEIDVLEEYARHVEILKKTVYKVKKRSMTGDSFYPKETADWVHLLMRAYRAYYELQKDTPLHLLQCREENKFSIRPHYVWPNTFSLIVGKEISLYFRNAHNDLLTADQLKAMLLSGNYIGTGTNRHATVFLIDGNKDLLFYNNMPGTIAPVPEFKDKNIQNMTGKDFIDTLFRAIESRGLEPDFQFLYTP